jgi:uncharacterized protein
MDNRKAIVQNHVYYGKGVFAIDRIKKGEIVAVFNGLFYYAKSALNLPNDPPIFAGRHAVQYAEGKWRDSNGMARYINHSCNPNCGIKELFGIVAMRDISTGEEITWDYAMTENSDWTMRCTCGSDRCRGVVGAFRMLSEEDKDRYEGYISEWLLK